MKVLPEILKEIKGKVRENRAEARKIRAEAKSLLSRFQREREKMVAETKAKAAGRVKKLKAETLKLITSSRYWRTGAPL
ncbi:MAG: hypothetical protein K6T73_06245 [Candidatus Bathyarchaeota archaeon]|nr:hypothetical protein [Candidatus Bathyarchaeota archaeon]